MYNVFALEAVVNDDIIGMVLVVGALFGGAFNGAVAWVVMALSESKYDAKEQKLWCIIGVVVRMQDCLR